MRKLFFVVGLILGFQVFGQADLLPVAVREAGKFPNLPKTIVVRISKQGIGMAWIYESSIVFAKGTPISELELNYQPIAPNTEIPHSAYVLGYRSQYAHTFGRYSRDGSIRLFGRPYIRPLNSKDTICSYTGYDFQQDNEYYYMLSSCQNL